MQMIDKLSENIDKRKGHQEGAERLKRAYPPLVAKLFPFYKCEKYDRR
jgi:hypothetical protein